MSTEIKAAEYGRVRLTAGTFPSDSWKPCLAVTLTDADGQYPDGRTVPRADFLAAVAKECDVIVIDRVELPGVTPSGVGFGVGPHFLSANGHEIAASSHAQLVRDHSLALLALAEYLDANPPVDEAQVEALAALFVEVFPGEMSREPIRLQERARRLLATGRIEVKP